MLAPNGDGKYIAGPLDVLCILHRVKTNTYHAAFLTEAIFPGLPIFPPDVNPVHLRSQFHHTEGAPDLAGALVHLEEMATKILVPETNIWREPKPWDGEPFTRLVENWLPKETPT